MTDFTPEVKVMYLPPNTIHSATKTELTGLVDYNINIFRGTTEFINPPYPGECNLSLLFDEDYIPEVEIGSWVEIQVKNSSGAYEIIHAGNVTNRTSSYRAHGLVGYLLEWQFSITSPISILQNTTFTENGGTGASAQGITATIINPSAVAFSFDDINAGLQWINYGPGTWADVDATREFDYPSMSFYGAGSIGHNLDPGTYNVWDYITKMYYGQYGYIVESPNGSLDLYDNDASISVTATFTPAMLDIGITGSEQFETLRNRVIITQYDATAKTYNDNESVAQYGIRQGQLDTYMYLTGDVDTVGAKILNSLAYPILSTQQIGLNLLNPIFTNAQRDLLLTNPLGHRVTVQAPNAMGGELDYLGIGVNYTVNKNNFTLDLNLAPYASVFNTLNWEQIEYNYTWTSYGVAFPTQEWQDL